MNIVDLFSGAGGLTFGFYYKLRNGIFIRNKKNNFIFANEYDQCAVNAYNKNFPQNNMIQGDIRDLSDEKISKLVGDNDIDIVIGGPPCQSFSTIGQRRYDEKAKLFWEYLRVLRIVKPKVFLFENVKGLLSMKEIVYKKACDGEVLCYKTAIGKTNNRKYTSLIPEIESIGKNVLEIILDEFQKIGYNVNYQIVNAVDFGVPQNRERVLLFGVRKNINKEFKRFYVPKYPHLTIKDAISDLPIVGEGERVIKYNSYPKTDYQKLLRGDCVTLNDHFCGHYGDKIRTVIKNIRQGEGKDDFNRLVNDGKLDIKYYLTSGFANTYGRLKENEPSTTITNNLATPSGLRCIHYSQNRALTPREGARIQSFPDWFEFDGSRTHITRQIGNAVPPLMALELAAQIESFLRR